MKTTKIRLLISLVLSFTLVSSVLSGCSSKSTNADSNKETQVSKGDGEPLGKYSPELNVTVANFMDSTVKFPQGQSNTDNVWTKAYKDNLGINVKTLWVVDTQQFEQKMNVTIASGDLPDIFPVTGKQLSQLVESGSIEDLSSVYDKYASDLTKDIYSQDKQLFELGKRDGKLYGLPNTGGSSALDTPQMLYIREDWRKKLNLPEPKTIDDFFKIADAFTNQDPDGNGKKDTYALALHKYVAGAPLQGFADLQGLANAFHAYLTTWIKDDSGKIVYGSIQPEVKVLLQKLQDMYKNGQIDKEFSIKDMAKATEGVVAGKVGMEFGMMWNPFFPLQSSIVNDKNTEWKAYPIPTSDGKPVKVSTSVTTQNFWVVKKGFKNPEAVVKMLNLFTEKFWGKTADNNLANGDGVDFVPFKYALPQAWPAKKNVNIHNNIVTALKSNDASKLNPEEKGYYDKIQAYLKNGDVQAGWGTNAIFGENSTYDVINYYINNNMYLYNEYNNIPTPSMVDKGSTLDKMENETFIKIIMGAPIDEFDKFVENWNKLGGDAITKELNEAK
ncbi:extracellular solute-binding protein [Clostridium sp. SYSU_GA19001]|uniref:extracellular solute-binding protein n=1 Tax=Clostridium caldaquaticum TaxID=2940653 RepID=UPI00207719B8|nr:extracellular solute-binding protein [Clostridium caldaquaticum]MCM8711523.1 extracellular solute-binding protein [Clostridium caldaquaticum]